VTITLPEEWVEIDPRVGDVAAELAAEIPLAAEENRELLVALLAPLAVRLGRLSAVADVVLAGFYTGLVEVEGEETPFVMSAQVTLALSPPIGGADVLQELLGGDGVEVMPVDLPAGEAVLVSGATEVDDPAWDEPQPAHLRRYFVPVAGMSRMAALSFMTPNLDLVDQFDEVFDAIARTLRFS
jgi:hypothetical protein